METNVINGTARVRFRNTIISVPAQRHADGNISLPTLKIGKIRTLPSSEDGGTVKRK